MIKIAVFIDRWMSGGIESYLVSSYENMNLSDVSISIITTQKFTSLYDERLNYLGIKIKELIPETKDSEFTRILNSTKPFREELTLNHYDVLHLNIYNGFSLIYSKIAKDCGVARIIAHSHSSNIGQVRLRRLKYVLHNYGKFRYTHYISDYWACSDLAGQWLFRKKLMNKVVYIKNGVDTKRFNYSSDKRLLFREKYGLNKNGLILGSLGRLTSEKNQLFLIDIAKDLRSEGINFTLLIAGEGKLKEKIEHKIKSYSLQENIKLIGIIDDTPSFYSGIDMFLLPSLFEGNPIVGLEAQCSGVVCLFSDQITRQAKLNDSSVFLSLESTKEWVDMIKRYQNTIIFRFPIDDSAIVSDCDIVETTKNLKLNLVK